MNSFSVKCVIMGIAAGSSYAMVFWNFCRFWAEWGLLGSLSQLADSSQISDHANVVIIGTAVVKLFTHLKAKQINKHSRSVWALMRVSTDWYKIVPSGANKQQVVNTRHVKLWPFIASISICDTRWDQRRTICPRLNFSQSMKLIFTWTIGDWMKMRLWTVSFSLVSVRYIILYNKCRCVLSTWILGRHY